MFLTSAHEANRTAASPPQREQALEEQLERTVNAKVEWTDHGQNLAAARAADNGGIYVIKDASGRLCYVGETKTFNDRLQAHRRARLKCKGSDPSTWRIATGLVTDLGDTVPKNTPASAVDRRTRRAVEHAVIRHVIQQVDRDLRAAQLRCGQHKFKHPDCGLKSPLENRSSHTPFKIDKKLHVEHVNPPNFTLPSGRPARVRTIRGKAGHLHELWLD